MTVDYAARLEALRAALAEAGHAGFLIPMADEYQSEYVPASARRVEFMSGFTGSSGSLIVLSGTAAFFTDSRYTLQAQQQVPGTLFTIFDSADKTPADWLAENASSGSSIAYDPWLHTEDALGRLRKSAAKAKATLVPVERNPIDAIWRDRPAPPAAPIYAHDLAYAGKSSADKCAALAAELKKNHLAAAVITDPASVAWLLNIRGGDVPNTPLPLSFAILYGTGRVKWFVDPRKATGGLDKHLGARVDIEHPGQFPHALDRLGFEGGAVRIDPSGTAGWIFDRLRAANAALDCGDDPCALPRACKNPIELEGMRAAHRRDGAALTEFFAWLAGTWPSGAVTELSAEEKLAALRAEGKHYRGPSFDTIAGAGGHGAIVHYRATPATNRTLEEGQLFLLDSGGQYLDGTTDVTRTVTLGAPSRETRDRFTRVLKGHIALASVRFPEGTSGAELDALARQFLWAAGLDYGHGTGHGVGCYLGVHEGPQGISKRGQTPLRPGMVVSNEPGYYKPGAYGIRIESLYAVIELPVVSGERKMLGFDVLTLAALDRSLIDASMLLPDEKAWLDAYHARVREALSPMVSQTARAWLLAATEPL